MKTPYIFAIVFFIFLVALALVLFFPRSARSKTQVTVLDHTFDVYVASSTAERMKGLSGTEIETLGADGMLFEFGNKEVRTFWMNNMNYDLDILWIDGNKIVAMDKGVPAPEKGESPARVSSDPFEVDYVLELPAGDAAKFDLYVGQTIEIK